MGLENHALQRKIRMNVLVYCDGKTNVFEISKIINVPLNEVLKELKILFSKSLIKFL